MPISANIVVSFVALLHGYILVLELFLWDTAQLGQSGGNRQAQWCG